MKSMFRCLLVAFGGYALGAQAAWYQQPPPTLSAGVTNLKFTLVDLNAADGIDPSFQVLAGAGRGRTTHLWRDLDSWLGLHGSGTPFDTLKASNYNGRLTRATGADFATVSGTGHIRQQSPGRPTAYACYLCRGVLSPNTLLVISGDYHMVGQDSGARGEFNYRAASRVAARVQVQVSDSGGVLHELDRSQTTVRDRVLDGFDDRGSFAFEVRNFADASKEDLVMSFGVHGYTNGLTLPEPTTYAMLAGGLALVGGIARRRRPTG